MISVQEIKEQLDHIWSRFKAIGVTSDITIIEHIAALLAEGFDFAEEEYLRPHYPEYPDLDVENVKRTLEKLSLQLSNTEGKAHLLDPYVLFCLREDQGNGQFPIPRHIVDTMLSIARVQPKDTLIDITCGSGGILIRRRTDGKGNHGKTVGIEIDAQWARIAKANSVLHGINIHIERGNALRIASTGGPLDKETFDCVIMAPSFGRLKSQELIDEGVDARNNMAHLTTLTLEKLNADGRAAIIVPTTFVTRTAANEQALRQRLIERYRLEAVVFLPESALYPFSSLPTSLLVIQNKKPEDTSSIWYCNAVDEGYQSPIDRYQLLTTQPSTKNDLSFVTQLVLHAYSHEARRSWEITNAAGKPCLKVDEVHNGYEAVGIVLYTPDQLSIRSVSLYNTTEELERKQQFLLVETTSISAKEEEHYTCFIDLLSLDKGFVSHPQQFLRQRYDVAYGSGADIPHGKLLFEYGQPDQRLAVTVDGHLIGINVAQRAADVSSASLMPQKYQALLKNTPHVQISLPAVLLGNVRKNQRRLHRSIDSLMGRMELKPIAEQQIPPHLHEFQEPQEQGSPQRRPPRLIEQDENNIFFSREQQAVWERVRQQVRLVHDYKTASYFTADMVEAVSRANTLSTLDVLVRMGLIVPVTVSMQDGKQAAFYRRITERDIWSLTPEER